MEYWKGQYQYCMDDSDLVVIGDIKNVEKLDSTAGKPNWGYIKYKISVKTKNVLKGQANHILDYTAWYEGKLDQMHKISGNGLFCLCTKKNGDIFDPDGFSRAPINDELESYVVTLSFNPNKEQLTRCSN